MGEKIRKPLFRRWEPHIKAGEPIIKKKKSFFSWLARKIFGQE